MPSAFEELCLERNVQPEAWRQQLASPILAEKCLLDMTDEELEAHYSKVEERADTTKEDRALIMLERAQEGRLERQAGKVFEQNAIDGKVVADQVPEMLEALRFEVTNTEVHYLLRKFGATEDFDMIPEKELTERQWFWLVGECQMLKDSYKHVNPEAFEICYESLVQNQKLQREAGMSGAEWPHQNPALQLSGAAATASPARPHIWGINPDVEAKLFGQAKS